MIGAAFPAAGLRESCDGDCDDRQQTYGRQEDHSVCGAKRGKHRCKRRSVRERGSTPVAALVPVILCRASPTWTGGRLSGRPFSCPLRSRATTARREIHPATRHRSCSVPIAALPWPMPEPDDDLTPARAEDLRACVAYALTSDGRLAKAQSAELMASIVAERLIARLERDGFVVMRRPPAPGHGAGRGREGR